MKRIILYLLLLISPFLFIIFINKTQSDGKPYIINLSAIGGKSNQYALNSEQDFDGRCSWYCHTNGCKHKSIIYQGVIKDLYDNIIKYNKNKPLNYQEMNVLLFVFVLPFLIYVLIIFNIELYVRNKKKQIV
jgi:hypothetical protein